MSVVVEFRLVGGQDAFPFHMGGARKQGVEGLPDCFGCLFDADGAAGQEQKEG